jgi:hypothetical protein
MHLHFAQDIGCTTHMICTTLRKFSFQKTCRTFMTLVIHRFIEKTKICKKNEWTLKLVKNLDNECGVQLHFRTSYHCNLRHFILEYVDIQKLINIFQSYQHLLVQWVIVLDQSMEDDVVDLFQYWLLSIFCCWKVDMHWVNIHIVGVEVHGFKNRLMSMYHQLNLIFNSSYY